MLRYSAWTKEETRKLTRSVEGMVKQGRHICWKEVAEAVGTGRTARMCRGKWEWQLGGNGCKRRWNDEENRLIWKMRHEEFQPWRIICPVLMRGINDCRSHYKTLLKYFNRPKVTLKLTEPIFTENPFAKKDDDTDDAEFTFEWENDDDNEWF
jgi:hypothetical protein